MEAQKRLHITVHLQVSDPSVEVCVHVVKRPIDPHPVLLVAASQAEMEVAQILGKGKKDKEVMVRQICLTILREQEHRTLQDIAAILNYKDHTVIVRNLQKHKNYMKYDEAYQKMYYRIFNNYKLHLNND